MPNRISITPRLKKRILERDSFRCLKCGFRGLSDELEVHHSTMRMDGGKDKSENLVTLCSICHHYAPDSDQDFEHYLKEKIDGNILDTFRKSQKSISKRTKKGMTQKSLSGNPVSRAPFGYKIIDKKLLPSENSSLVQELFQEFLNSKISLTQLSKKYGLTVNGLKKILTNQTYLGKVKFDGQTHQGEHQSLISATLFNHVQNKLKDILRA